MAHFRPYATGAMFKTVVIDAVDDPPGLRFESAPTLAAADLEVSTDKNGGPAECSAQYTTFTSGSEEPVVGDTLTNNSQTAIYIGSVLTSGDWGGTAAGYMFHAAPSGAFASGAIGISGGTADVATASGAATDVAGVFDEQVLWVALTATEMTCMQGLILVHDATATPVWADDAISFETVGSSGLHEDVVGDLDTSAATGAPTTTDSLMAYIKQLVNELQVVDGIADNILTDTGTTLQAELDGIQADTEDIQTRLPAALVGGRMDSDVGAVAMTDIGGIDVSELNSIVDDLLDAGRLDALIDAIKAKTDSLTFTNANEVDANTKSINNATVVGDGNATPWDGA